MPHWIPLSALALALLRPDAPVAPAPVSRAVRATPASARLTGTVLALFPDQAEAVVKVWSRTGPDGKTVALDPPRAKRLVLTAVPHALDLIRGETVTAEGVDLGRGRALRVDRLEVVDPDQPGDDADTADGGEVADGSGDDPEAMDVDATPALLDDFEALRLPRWQRRGNAWDARLDTGQIAGVRGAVYLSSAHPRPGERNADSGTGVATSATFPIAHRRLRFRIGGGNYPGACSANLRVDGKIVRTATGNGSDRLEEIEWDLTPWVGQRAQVELVDARGVGPFGYLLVDHFELLDPAPDAPEPTPEPSADPPDSGAPAPGVTLADGTRVEGRRLLTLEATGYGPGENGRWGDRTKLGTRVGYGTVAVDPRVIPLRSRLWVEGYGFCIALDVGSAIKGRRIDLGHDDDITANLYGRQKVRVLVLD